MHRNALLAKAPANSTIVAFAVLSVLLLLGCSSEQPDTTTATATTAGTTERLPPTTTELADASTVQINLNSPSQQDPVAVGMGLSDQAIPRNGQTLLVVRTEVADGWHIYATEGPIGVGIATQLDLTLPSGVTMGDWTLPEKETKQSSQGEVGMHHGSVQFSVPLTVSDTAVVGDHQIQCEFGYQACTDTQCQRPMKAPLTVSMQITE